MTTTMFIVIVVAVITIILVWRDQRKSPADDCDRHGYLDVESTPEITVPVKQVNTGFKLEAVSVCVGYADFLAWTLPFNRHHFDRLVIVTSPEDEATQRLCEFWHVECVVTDEFYRDGATFNKGRGINEGLKRLDRDGWVLHFDSDIFLYPRTREIMQLLPLDEETLYGVDRVNCYGLKDWVTYIGEPEIIHGNNGFMAVKRFENGSRLLNLARDGYVPIGYFQLWHPETTDVHTYPTEHTTADRSDTLFSYNWHRRHRQILPELACVHLESAADLPLGANWRGRTTSPFTLT